ncbi:hypothetical protein L6164_001969 [Bauhinia variegata]|uniref:Uncharacterized protein n=1 Tax=Bauhinia variegata TaxID=167791 RepID=A0ACB9QB77_BAUVA|nr:hypothetical protein L6164_001969 [Bauhinia variegata]
MFPTRLSSAYAVCSDAAGVAGNVFAVALFVSPIPTFKQIVRNQSTQQFSGLPYIYALFNCLICLWYGSPFVSPGVTFVATVNSIGVLFQLVYIATFIMHANNAKRLKMLGSLIAVLSLFIVLVYASMRLFDGHSRQNLVIKTTSVQYMPFYLSLSTFLMSFSFFGYGALKDDPFIYVPNGIGIVLGLVQLLVYCYYSSANTSREDSRREALLDHHP